MRCVPPWVSFAGTAPRNRPVCNPPVCTAGLHRLPALCDAITATSAPVTVRVEGEEQPLPTPVDHAYGILTGRHEEATKGIVITIVATSGATH